MAPSETSAVAAHGEDNESPTQHLHQQKQNGLLVALSAAPRNVFLHAPHTLPNHVQHKWTNYYELPVEYTVEIQDDLLSPRNNTLATQYMPPGLKRRFIVLDDAVHRLYGPQIDAYFKYHGVSVHTVVVKGEEDNKIWDVVDRILNELCEFNILRREPILAIGGGCVLDIVGFTASCYRRGIPYIRIPTTLLSIVDASVGVKCGIDWYHPNMGGLKNRIGSFYAPLAAFLDRRFIRTQNTRNLVNGMGEIMKLALIKSYDLFVVLEAHGRSLVENRFANGAAAADSPFADRVVKMSIQIMLEELGPNLWEFKLERCVDYGHTFSKILEMDSALMHGEAVNIDGFICAVLSYQKGWISKPVLDRIIKVMLDIGLPIWHPASCTLSNLKKAIEDGVQHRHGKLRMPLVRNAIGEYDFVNECTETDLRNVIDEIETIISTLQRENPGAVANSIVQ